MATSILRNGSVALALLLASQFSMARDPLRLISDAEFAQEKKIAARMPAGSELTPKSAPVPGSPVIELKKPKVQETLKAPFPIQLVFKSGEDAEVVPDSFKVLYGFMKLDITDRVVQNAKVTKDGILVDQANIPSGSHKLVLQIRDSKDRKAEVVMSFNVE